MITPKDVLALKKPTDGYLCPLSANTYGIEFIAFRIRDMDTNEVYFEVDRDHMDPDIMVTIEEPVDEDSMRCIKYNFPKKFLDAKTIGTTLQFTVGSKPVENFRMIERHYFGDKLIQSFDFTFGFCIPNSTNSWEAVYTVPKMSEKEKKEIVAAPFKTVSDSFYFVNDQLIMHNKAQYAYRDTK
eukprot:GEZU01014449.1.p1 GENE.GEZU01014449.1~~GEZU01014449.1.p1  ORF type:complete len:184 (+),score=47.27 GEZU01014449.1:187-738(+)